MTTWDVAVRLVTFAMVAGVAFVWPRDLRRHWHEWDSRSKRVTVAVIPVFVANGLGLLNAIYTGRPVTWVSYLLALSYLALVIALLPWPPDKRR